MESLVKQENLEDEEFQSISIEDTKLSEVVLPHDPCLLSGNGVKSMVSEMEVDDTSSTCSLPQSEADQTTTLTVDPSSTNDAISSWRIHDYRRIYSAPFFKIVQQLGQARDNYIVRCYTCGRLMKTKEKPSVNILNHMRSFHPEISKLYEKQNVSKYRDTRAPAATYVVKNSSTKSDTEVKNNNTENNIVIEIEIDDDDDAENENNTDNSESVHNESISSPVVEETFAEISAPSLKNLEVIINEKLRNLITETGFKELNDQVNELVKINCKKDIENTAIVEELKSQVEVLKNEYNALHLAVIESEASKRKLENELQKLENRLQQRKLIIRNITISDREQPIKDVEKLLKDNLGLHNVSILSCTIVTSSKPSTSTNTSNTECISVELSKAEDCKLVLKQMHKLKKSKVFIEPELSPLQRKRKNKLMIIRRELLSRKPDLKVLVRNATLVVKGKKFYWHDTDGLCHDDSTTPEAMQTSGVEYLKSLTDLDLKDFLNILQKYDIN